MTVTILKPGKGVGPGGFDPLTVSERPFGFARTDYPSPWEWECDKCGGPDWYYSPEEKHFPTSATYACPYVDCSGTMRRLCNCPRPLGKCLPDCGSNH